VMAVVQTAIIAGLPHARLRDAVLFGWILTLRMRGEGTHYQRSLIAKCQFPDTSKKFPVLTRREFGPKGLTYPYGSAVKTEEIRCIFLLIREFWLLRRFR
jgi:hypothetical protein